MGKMAHSGPLYGAKANLWTFGPYTDLHSTGATTGLLTPIATKTVPPYEDWMITELNLTCSTNSSVAATHGLYLKQEGGNTSITPVNQAGNGSTRANTIFSLTNPAGSTTWSTWATATADAGEYEGVWVPAGSSLRIVTSGVSVMAGVQVNVYGYIRFRNSTRAE